MMTTKRIFKIMITNQKLMILICKLNPGKMPKPNKKIKRRKLKNNMMMTLLK